MLQLSSRDLLTHTCLGDGILSGDWSIYLLTMIKVVLEVGEIETARILAQARYKFNRQGGVKNRKRSPESPASIEVNGMGAELAFCKAFNLWPDLTVGVRSGGGDALNQDGKSVDVKATPHVNGMLLVTPDKVEHGIDLYALVTGFMPYYNVIGYATRYEIFKKENMVDLGHGKSYGLPQEKLHEYDDDELQR